MAIWQDLVDQHGFAAGYASVRRYVRRLRRRPAPEAYTTITTAPGEEAQVDYGEGPMVRLSATGKYRRTRLFLFTLGYSRKSVRTFHSSTRTWAELHEPAFQRLGGAPALVILDSLREGVLTPDIYDPALNPLYRDVLAHYGHRPPVSGRRCRSERHSRAVLPQPEGGVRVAGRFAELFSDAHRPVRRWIRWYNDGRPHQALGYLSPRQYRARQLQRGLTGREHYCRSLRPTMMRAPGGPRLLGIAGGGAACATLFWHRSFPEVAHAQN